MFVTLTLTERHFNISTDSKHIRTAKRDTDKSFIHVVGGVLECCHISRHITVDNLKPSILPFILASIAARIALCSSGVETLSDKSHRRCSISRPYLCCSAPKNMMANLSTSFRMIPMSPCRIAWRRTRNISTSCIYRVILTNRVSEPFQAFVVKA